MFIPWNAIQQSKRISYYYTTKTWKKCTDIMGQRNRHKGVHTTWPHCIKSTKSKTKLWWWKSEWWLTLGVADTRKVKRKGSGVLVISYILTWVVVTEMHSLCRSSVNCMYLGFVDFSMCITYFNKIFTEHNSTHSSGITKSLRSISHMAKTCQIQWFQEMENKDTARVIKQIQTNKQKEWQFLN